MVVGESGFAAEGIGFESDENEVVLVLRTGETIPVAARVETRDRRSAFSTRCMKLRLALHAAR